MKRLLSASNLACYIRAAASVCLLLALILGTARIAGAQALTINVPDLGTYSIGLVEIPLTASGGSGAYTWSIFADVPPGLVLRSDVPSWFPPDTTEGLIGIATTPRSYTFTLEVSDGATSVDKQVRLNIIGLAVQTPFNLPDAFKGSPYSYQLAVSGFPNGATLAWSSNGSMPSGLSLGGDGLLSGTTSVSGFFTLPGGPLQVAVGAAYRKESINNPSSNPANEADPFNRYYSINAVGTWTHTLSPNILNEARFGACRSGDRTRWQCRGRQSR